MYHFFKIGLQVSLLFYSCFIQQAFSAEGDLSSADLTGQAWSALGQGKAQEAINITDQCIQLFEAEAISMQKQLKDFATGDEISQLWALNDVGTCYFIKAKALLNLNKPKEAKKAFEKLSKHLKFAQCWDPQGWYWYPAEAAREELASL